jgi:HK97 family phage portal protein
VGLLASIRSAVSRAIAPGPLANVGGSGGWSVVVREPYTGAWQRNEEIRADTALSHPAVYSCTTLIASDIGKVALRLVSLTDDGVWIDAESPAFSPVLRKPNRYHTINKFLETWMVSKLTHGNTYVLKQRDDRGVVVALYVLDPTCVTPLITPSGDVYYELKRDDLAGVPLDTPTGAVIVPASEIIHDICVALFHPLIGVSPIYACGLAALQGLNIQNNSTKFFANGSNPGGILTAPQKIADETAKRIADYWNTNFTGANVGKVAVLGDGLAYTALSVNPVDAQLIEQLKWTTETICACYHVPAALIDSSHQPPYANSEPLVQQYYSQCLQTHMTGIEIALDDGLALPKPYGTEFDIDDLIWFDTATRTKAAGETIRSGVLSPNEARQKYFGMGPVDGGDTPYLQQQMFSLAALAARDAADPFAKPTPAPAALPATTTTPDDNTVDFAKLVTAVHTKAIAAGLYAG